MSEVQRHGFVWQDDILKNVYGATTEEVKSIKYGSESDLPGHLNRKNVGVDLSVKTSSSPNLVCMADCIRIYDSVTSGKNLHMVVIQYKQDDVKKTKKIVKITEVNLTNSVKELFGSVTRDQLVDLDKAVKAVPQKRKPTSEEREKMYTIKNDIESLSGAIQFNIKCNSTQSRLQCSFNKFPDFLKENPGRIVAQSDNGNFREGTVIEEINSTRRVFKKKTS